MNKTKLRKLLHGLRYTPIHPQWFAFQFERKRHKHVGRLADGHVLDIGCGRQPIRRYLPSSCTYTSLDYLTTGGSLYDSKPNVFADAQSLPFSDSVFDTVLLLEVLEHLPDPKKAIEEAKRVLAPGGQIILSTPFLYPIHDAPGDYHRWTQFGLQKLLGAAYPCRDVKTYGNAIESASLLMCIAFASTALRSIESRSVRAILIPMQIIGVLFTNIVGWTLSKLFSPVEIMPIGYLITASESQLSHHPAK